jgi:hypothetical protein
MNCVKCLKEIDSSISDAVIAETGRPFCYYCDYEKESELTYDCYMIKNERVLTFEFEADCGKHGTHEPLASYVITAKDLMDLLRKREIEEDL